MSRRMLLSGFVIHCPAPHTQMSWIYPREKIRHQWHEPEYWKSIALTLERAKFDMMFFADQYGAYEVYKGSMESTIRYAAQFPVHDPVVLIPALSAVTERLGFAVTMSTTYYPPFLLTRMLSTLDHVTKGRIGWNIVTSFHGNEARNFGLAEVVPHDERYERAEEYMEVCHRLWNSWDRDAVVMDMEHGIFADPAKVRKIDFAGRWFNCAGPATVIPSPQHHPVLIQAGASGRGRDFAAKHAECIFAVQLTTQAMRAFVDDVTLRAAKLGKSPADLKVVWGVIPIVARRKEEARAKQKEILDRIPIEAGLAVMSGHSGYDLSVLDLDRPLADLEVPGIQGVMDIFTKTAGRKATLREAARQYGAGVAMPHIVGTPGEVADELERLLAEGGGDGFQFSPPYYAPDYFEDLATLLIPELQRRGLARTEYEGRTLRDHLTQA